MNLTRKVKPEQVAAFKASFEKCKEGTLQEPGCADYGMYQSYIDSTEFIIVETWMNKGEHLKHMETEHLKIHLEEIKDMSEPGFKAVNTTIYVCPGVN
jgi:quinol monooxygenase YgiN